MNPYLRSLDTEWFKKRLTVAMLCVIAVFLVLCSRLFHLQVVEGREYYRLSENNCIRLQGIDAPRGLIYDRNGKLLVDNRPSFDLSIVLKDAKPVDKTLKKLSRYIHIPEEALRAGIQTARGAAPYKPILLKEDIGRDMLAAVEVHQFDLPGIRVDVKPRRHYIHNSAIHLVGYLSEINPEELKSGAYIGSRGGDFIGRYGVEKASEDYLRGQAGGRQVEVNARGQVVKVLETVEAVPGKNVYLTIDHELQQKAESLLTGLDGAVVAMDPDTGQVIVSASTPAFDPNAFVDGMSREEWLRLTSDKANPLENKVIQGEYPPASTYKIVTAIAGLEEGVIDKNTTFYCPGHYWFGDRTFRCWKRGGHGRVNVISALSESCDVFFYQVGQRLGVDRLAEYAKACGLGAQTGVQLADEEAGLIPTAAWKRQRTGIPWQKGETLSIAIGQGYNLTTPLQMAVLISAVANGGVLLKPHILKTVETARGEPVYNCRREEVGRLPVSPENLSLVKKGLWEVVNDKKGTARLVRLEQVELSGKTGTAQVVGRKNTEGIPEDEVARHLRAHAWFVAYGRFGNSRLAVAVFVEHGEHGSGTAAPIAKELIKTYFLGDAHSQAVYHFP
ncbi:MAG: penicillin-binding protein 2 [Thermodesulfobacteriota bacterium]